MPFRHTDSNTRPYQRQAWIVLLVCTALAACSSQSPSDASSEPLSDPTSIDVSNDILIPPVLEPARPNPTYLTDGTAKPEPLISTGKPAANDFDAVGSSLAIDAKGTTLATGVPGHDANGYQDNGAVLVEFRVDEQWWFDSLLTTDVASENAQLGYATAISEDGYTIAAGAPHDRHNGRSSGAVFIFERFGEGWQATAELYSPAPTVNARFGHTVALQPDGNTLYVTESRPDGQVHIFQRISSQWQYTHTLTAKSDNDNAAESSTSQGKPDGFGITLSAANNGLLAVGAPTLRQEHKGKLSTGQVYLFRTNTPSPTLSQTISPLEIDDSTNAAWHSFGSAVALAAEGSTLVVSGIEQPLVSDGLLSTFDSGLQKSLAQVLVYTTTDDGQWAQEATLIPAGSHASDSVVTVAVSGDGQQILAGLSNSYWKDNQVSVLSKLGDVWTISTQLENPESHSETFGHSIAMTADGSRVLVSTTDTDGGKVYQWLPQ